MSQITLDPRLSAQALVGNTVAPGGLKYLGNNQYETSRYVITVRQGEVEVYDKQSKTSVKAWGDPHVTTGDGDKMQFQKDNLTIDLADGTKLTLKPTAADANGVSLIDSLAIMTPNGGAELVENISKGPTPGKHFDSSLELDRLWGDGTVLRAGKQVDDLFYASNGQEIVGGDANAKFGEHVLDGKGGQSSIGFMGDILKMPLDQLGELKIGDLLKLLQGGAFPQLPQVGAQGLEKLLGRINDLIQNGGAWADPSAPGNSGTPGLPSFEQGFGGMRQLIAALMEAMNRLGQGNASPLPGLPGFRPGDFQLPTLPQFPGQPGKPAPVGQNPIPGVGGSPDNFKNQVLGQVRSLDGQIGAIKSALASGNVPPEQQQQLQFELQELMEQKKQLIEMLTSIMKSEHEMKMSVIRNLAV